jgi:hypothetical protein
MVEQLVAMADQALLAELTGSIVDVRATYRAALM